MMLRWKIDRARAMGAAELVHRAGMTGKSMAERLGVGLARARAPRLVFGLPWVKSLTREVESESYTRVADSVLKGQYQLFGNQPLSIGFPPAWNRDPKTGRVAPRTHGKSLNYRDERIVGNIKYLWELNRHLELLTLAQAWHVSSNYRYAAACRTLLDSWFQQCPYPLGPCWASSLELGVRLVNWSFAWHLLSGSSLFDGEDGERFRHRWLSSIYQHCHFIAGWPSLYSSANNHLLGEQFGLFVAATTWPCWQESEAWLDGAQKCLERQALRQNAEDGVNREQAIWYHHEVADMMLIAGLVGRANGRDFGSAYWDRLEAMLEFIASIMDVNGHVPALGDADDAVMLRLSPSGDADVFRSLLATGAVLFHRRDFKAKAVRFDEKSRWLLGDDASSQFEMMSSDSSGLPVHRAFPAGGYYVLGSDFETPREIRIVADAGPLGYLSIAAHGHADALSFTLSAGGREFLIDPGTYTYRADPIWRDYFRGTAAHNTVRIDGVDQSISGGSFLWTRHAKAVCEEFKLTPDCESLVAHHDGYLKLRAPVTHRRSLFYVPHTRTLHVEDEILTDGAHLIEMNWHFSEDCQVDIGSRQATVENDGVVLLLSWPKNSAVRVVSGQNEPPLGWVSRRFDFKQPSSTIVVTDRTGGTWKGMSQIRIV